MLHCRSGNAGGARCPTCANVSRLPTVDVSLPYLLRGLAGALLGGAAVGAAWGYIAGSTGFGLFFLFFLGLGIGWALTFSSVRNGATGPRYRTVSESGARMCLASDAMNVAPWAPFQTLWYVTTGDTLLPGVSGVPEDQRLSREEALRHAAVECAWNMAQEDRLGSLEVGKHGDLIVLSDDYFAVADDAIKDITSVLTVVDGRIVFADGEYAGLEE